MVFRAIVLVMTRNMTIHRIATPHTSTCKRKEKVVALDLFVAMSGYQQSKGKIKKIRKNVKLGRKKMSFFLRSWTRTVNNHPTSFDRASSKDIPWNNDILVYFAIDKSVRERSKPTKNSVLQFEGWQCLSKYWTKIIYVLLSLFDRPCLVSFTADQIPYQDPVFLVSANIVLLSVIFFSFYRLETWKGKK